MSILDSKNYYAELDAKLSKIFHRMTGKENEAKLSKIFHRMTGKEYSISIPNSKFPNSKFSYSKEEKGIEDDYNLAEKEEDEIEEKMKEWTSNPTLAAQLPPVKPPAPAPRQMDVACLDNTGMEDKFDVGIAYVSEGLSTSNSDLLIVYDKNGDKGEFFRERFKIIEETQDRSACESCKHYDQDGCKKNFVPEEGGCVAWQKRQALLLDDWNRASVQCRQKQASCDQSETITSCDQSETITVNSGTIVEVNGRTTL